MAEFHNLVAWNKMAEICQQLLAKGMKVYVEGSLNTRSWEAEDGSTRYKTEIRVEDMIQESGGEVLDADVWGKRYLAYPIKGHNEGYYIIYDFKIGPEYIAEIKRTMQLKQEVLKFMVIKVENADKVRKSIKKKEIEI